jgi:hypothetical protein
VGGLNVTDNPRSKDITGQVFGRLTAVRRAGVDAYKNARWECLCECGNTKTTSVHNLRQGRVQSCGCLRRELASKLHRRVGGRPDDV